ncbi:MAG: hypothetical protein H7A41_08710 [Chlamydiales bacterium]|nr:hypothetical protein [Chlamydiales bacterium]
MTVLKELKPLSPAAFFDVRVAIPKADKKRSFRKGSLPDGSGLTGEGSLAKVALLWSPTGLFFEVDVKLAMEEGDFLELFIDTRDLKNSNVITRFCHHFIFYPEEEEGMEVTRFRGDDSHPLADPSLFSVKTTVKRSSYLFEIGIPKEVLYGYDPLEFKRLGFTYRFQKKSGEKQHFNLSSDFFHIEKHPALWASLILSEEK